MGRLVGPLVAWLRRVQQGAGVRFYCAELALALQCAHDHGVVYRDVRGRRPPGARRGTRDAARYECACTAGSQASRHAAL